MSMFDLGLGQLVYLDTADWSYLQEGRVPAEEGALRDIAKAGRSSFPITVEHLVEAAGLDSGLEARLRYWIAFPGAIWIALGGDHVVRTEVANFAADVLGQPRSQGHFEVGRLRDMSVDQLTRIVREAKLARRVSTMSAKTVVGAPTPSAEKRRDFRFLVRLALQDDVGSMMGWLEKRGYKRTGVTGAAQTVAMHALRGLVRKGQQYGAFSAAPTLDEPFERIVVPRVSSDARASQKDMKALFAAWSDEQRLRELSPSLAVLKALHKANPISADYKKVLTFEMDRLHAVHAPYVSVFTCDKRNAGPIRNALRDTTVTTRVIRTHRLAEVVDALS